MATIPSKDTYFIQCNRTNSLIDKVKSININKDPRGREKPSDHTPIEINLA